MFDVAQVGWAATTPNSQRLKHLQPVARSLMAPSLLNQKPYRRCRCFLLLGLSNWPEEGSFRSCVWADPHWVSWPCTSLLSPSLKDAPTKRFITNKRSIHPRYGNCYLLFWCELGTGIFWFWGGWDHCRITETMLRCIKFNAAHLQVKTPGCKIKVLEIPLITDVQHA